MCIIVNDNEQQLLKLFQSVEVMKIKGNKKEFLRFYLGLADEKEKQKVFHSKESDEMLLGKWESNQDLKDQGNSFDKNAVFQRIQNEISSKPKRYKHLNVLSFVRKYAAILIIGLIFGSAALYFGLIQPALRNYMANVELTNSNREKLEVILPDGSKVALNTKSTIKYPKAFSNTNRTVELIGEAYFEVKRDTTKPFTVKTSEIDVEVLGTSFNVMAYNDDSIIETTLITGKVKVTRFNPNTKQNQSVILSPNHKATFIKADERFILDKVDVNTSIAWKSGKLIIDNESLELIAKKLERRYDVKIVISDDLTNKFRYTLSIDDETIEEVLEMIKKTSPVNYTKAKGEIVFYLKK